MDYLDNGKIISGSRFQATVCFYRSRLMHSYTFQLMLGAKRPVPISVATSGINNLMTNLLMTVKR
jgi:hypothetical protein